MITFKHPNLELEFNTIHPDVRNLIVDLAVFCTQEDLPAPFLTEVLRTPEEQEEIYYKQFMRQFSLDEAAARRKARNKDSLHLWGCAVDIRDKNWSPKQKATVVDFLRKGMNKVSKKQGAWEFIPQIHGTGPHLHVARKDDVWIREYRAKHDKPFDIVVGFRKNNEDPSA